MLDCGKTTRSERPCTRVMGHSGQHGDGCCPCHPDTPVEGDGWCLACHADRRLQQPKKTMWAEARKRAKKRGLAFDLKLRDIPDFPDVCPVLGIPIVVANGKALEGSPSLDRIRPKDGYIRGNIRVISWRANLLKSNASLEELKLLVLDAEKTQRKHLLRSCISSRAN